MKKLAILTRSIKILISLAGILMLIGWLIAPATWNKPLSYLVTIILPYIPNFFKLLKIEFSTPLVLAYELFIIVAMVLGIDLGWYRTVLVMASGDSYYDKIVHFSSGILVAAVGQELFSLHERHTRRKSSRWFQALFLLGAVALVAVLWECYEFLYDQFFDGNMQELVKAGVADTMWDMIASLVGGSICIAAIILLQSSKTTAKSGLSIDKK